MEKPYRAFCCSAREDEYFLQELKKRLMPLEHDGWITVKTDLDIDLGKDYKLEVDHHLETADIILLLISPDFIASDYCFNEVVPKAIERHEQGTAYVILIIIRPTDWQGTRLGQLPVLPKDLRSISTWADTDVALLNVVNGIRTIIPVFPQNPKLASPSLEKGSKALWNEDYNSAKRELHKAIEEIEEDSRPEEAAKARYFLALALLGRKRPRIHTLSVIEEVERLLSKASKHHNLYSYTYMLAIILYDFADFNGFPRLKEKANKLWHKAQNLTRVAEDNANIELFSRTQPDSLSDYGSRLRI